ncbi:PadR family transcriptional regulator [Reyranella sp.]|uniref:PadR family transcriptional regulator n=1 Tax=Reyranella sp. TaxID=1929291 RepID=UPI00120AA09D|nr:PadR family transcriptional regulator [Reyranella sp.]TAJ85233.1 MAG: PadR family transcriptional regulator [Reyranella sp.]
MRPSHHHGHEGHRHHFGRRGPGHHGRGWDSGSGERRGGRRRVFDSAELRLVLLKLIADQPRHGYELIRAIEDLTGGSYVPSPGMVYPTLTMLLEMGHVAEAKSEGPRKAFAVTEDGISELAAKKTEVDALFARLAELANQQERTDSAPIRRAMSNLRAVLIHRLGREDIQMQTLHEAVSIIDEAAQKIERLT